MTTKEKLLSAHEFYGLSILLEATDEIEHLENITRIQQNQIERLIDARDAEKLRADTLTQKLSPAAECLATNNGTHGYPHKAAGA